MNLISAAFFVLSLILLNNSNSNDSSNIVVSVSAFSLFLVPTRSTRIVTRSIQSVPTNNRIRINERQQTPPLFMRSDDADADADADADIIESESKIESAIFSQSKEEVHCLLVGGGDNCNIDNIDNDDNIDIEMGLSLEDLKKYWVELNELMEDEELLPEELGELFQKSLKENGNKLDKKGFYALYTSIDALFYTPEDDNDDDKNDEDYKETAEPEITDKVDLVQRSNDIKTKLLSTLNKMTINAKNNKQLTCGFDCDDEQRKEIKDLIVDLSSIIPVMSVSSSDNHNMDDIPNLVTNNNNTNKNNKKKKLTTMQAMGEWKLLYTCSHAMLINRSLSGLGRSTSAKAQFLGLRKKMAGSRFLGTVEYIETFGGVVSDNDDDNGNVDVNVDDDDDDVNVDDDDDDDVSFEVVVAGEWYFQQKNNEYTNLPAPCLTVELESVKYGPTTNGADQWSSLGPVKLTDFIYLDDDLMILRGNVNTNSLFVWKRIVV